MSRYGGERLEMDGIARRTLPVSLRLWSLRHLAARCDAPLRTPSQV